MNEIIAQKIKDFLQEDIPPVFERNLSLGEIQEPAKGNLVTVVVGVRRCGKTYRLYQEMHHILDAGHPKSSILYFNFEDERLKPYRKELLSEVVETFYALNPSAQEKGAYFFFDEIQEIPEWGTFLRRMVDTQKATIYVSGSSSKMLSAELASEFRGRALTRELFPLSFSEYVAYTHAIEKPPSRQEASNGISSQEENRLRNALSSYLVRGGFIPVQQLSDSEAVQLLQEYALRTVNLDVIERYKLKNPTVATQFLSRCLASSARELSISKIHSAFKGAGVPVARESLSRLLEYYEEAYLVFTLKEFSRAIADNPRQTSKVYAVDPGMFVAFSPASAKEEGQRLETAVFDKLRRELRPQRTGSIARAIVEEEGRRHEINFVTGDALFQDAYQLVQVSVSLADAQTKRRETAALQAAMRRYGLARATIVTLDEKDRIESEEGTIEVVPAWQWLLDDEEDQPSGPRP